ncbi:MAG: helix-turn-helix domain-containing protein [Limisphaerales bacterium]
MFASPAWLHSGKMRRLEMSDAFALVLRQHRESKALSQETLAEKADLHPTYIGMLERSLRNPSLNVTKALARALGVPLAKLIAEAEAIQQKANPKK